MPHKVDAKNREKIARLFSEGVSSVALAEQYGVSRQTIMNYVAAHDFPERPATPPENTMTPSQIQGWSVLASLGLLSEAQDHPHDEYLSLLHYYSAGEVDWTPPVKGEPKKDPPPVRGAVGWVGRQRRRYPRVRR